MKCSESDCTRLPKYYCSNQDIHLLCEDHLSTHRNSSHDHSKTKNIVTSLTVREKLIITSIISSYPNYLSKVIQGKLNKDQAKIMKLLEEMKRIQQTNRNEIRDLVRSWNYVKEELICIKDHGFYSFLESELEFELLELRNRLDELSQFDIESILKNKGLLELVEVSDRERKIQVPSEGTTIYEQVLPVSILAFSPDNLYLASEGINMSVMIWELHSNELLHTLTGHTGKINSICFSMDGSIIASGSEDRTIRICYVRSGKLVSTLTAHEGSVTSVAFSTDIEILASSSSDATIRLWNALRRTKIHTFRNRSKTVYSVSFVSGGKYLVSASAENTVDILDITTKMVVRSIALKYKISSISCSPYASYIVTAGLETKANLWNKFKALNSSGSLNQPEVQETGILEIFSVLTSKKVRISNSLLNHVTSISISIDGLLIVAATQNTRAFKSELLLVETSSQNLFLTSSVLETKIVAISISPYKDLIAIGGNNGVIYLASLPQAIK